jgi:hypothetical protein
MGVCFSLKGLIMHKNFVVELDMEKMHISKEFDFVPERARPSTHGINGIMVRQ